MARQVRDLEFKAVYEPDMSRMVKALRILLEYQPDKTKQTPAKKDAPPEATGGAGERG